MSKTEDNGVLREPDVNDKGGIEEQCGSFTHSGCFARAWEHRGLQLTQLDHAGKKGQALHAEQAGAEVENASQVWEQES